MKKNRRLQKKHELPKVLYDRCLIITTLLIIALGLTMVASSSIVMSEKMYHWPFHFLVKQSVYFVLGLFSAFFIVRVEVETLKKAAPFLLLGSLFLLFLVLVPGIGRHINGSARWIGFGPLGIQVSELAKFAIVVYFASYLFRKNEEVKTHMSGFLKPMFILGVAAILLLAEPDFGTTVVITATTMGMMFMAGVRVRQFAILMALVLLALAVLAISSPYRLARLTSFLNPWAHQYGSGYQLTQSLIAFGRGGWSGVGLGNSVQKLFYLPEAHTDFLFAVLGEELGLLGIFVVIILYTILVYRILYIGRKAQALGQHFSGYLAYGFALWLGMQFIVNVGVNTGMLPTKGLTLPLMSYGGSSVLVNCIVIACLLRVDYELRLKALGVNRLNELRLGRRGKKT